jgi:hypothetical protein
MKFRQNLEIVSAVFTPVSAALYPVALVYYGGLVDPATGKFGDMIWNWAMIWTLTLPFTIGICIYATTGRRLPLVIAFISGFLFIGLAGFIGFFIMIWSGPFASVLAAAGIVFTILTMCLTFSDFISRTGRDEVYR